VVVQLPATFPQIQRSQQHHAVGHARQPGAFAASFNFWVRSSMIPTAHAALETTHGRGVAQKTLQVWQSPMPSPQNTGRTKAA
jgi:hypothetical protein